MDDALFNNSIAKAFVRDHVALQFFFKRKRCLFTLQLYSNSMSKNS